jgi:nicotinamide mononucleotide transporter
MGIWLQENYIELFGAITGIIYVFLEIRQNIWLWPLGILTSAVYIWVFFTSKFYADMSLQVYYLAISVLGWYWWAGKKSRGHGAEGMEQGAGEIGRRGERGNEELRVTRIGMKMAIRVLIIFVVLYAALYFILSKLTDSPVPQWDSFITALSIVATWMLARKIYEHWYLWVVVNSTSAVIFFIKHLYPTVILYIIYGVMSFAGMIEWKKSMEQGAGSKGQRAGSKEQGAKS